MAKDLRGFIAELEKKSPGDVARIKKPVSPRYEMSALLTHLEKKKRFPLLFFENVEGGRAPVVINAMASRRLMAIALETKPEDLARKFTEHQAKMISPVEVSDGPVQQMIKVGHDVDLAELPMLTHYDVNAAPYITAGIVAAQDPDTGVRNTSYNVVIANAQGSELDPTAGPGGVNAKMGIDATKPLTGFPPPLRVPDEVMNRIRLEDFLPQFSK